MINKATLNFWIKKICDFMKQRSLVIDPMPKIEIIGNDMKKNDPQDILISTGGYAPATQTIYLFVDNRHIKDILRSFCHEMIHHTQYLDNPDYITRIMAVDQDDVDGNLELEEIEGEAYLKGNLVFRKFTEQFKKQMKGK